MNAVDRSEAATEELVEIERVDEPVEIEAERVISFADLRKIIG